MISTLELVIYVVGGITLVSLAYSSFWAFAIRKALYGQIYRRRALWTGGFATYSALEIALIVYMPRVVGSLIVDLTWLVVGSVLLFILAAWVSSTVNVVISLDPFHRNRLKWNQAKKFVWVISGIIAAMNVLPALIMVGLVAYVPAFAILNYAQTWLLVGLFVYLIAVVISYLSVNFDRLLKAYLRSFFYLLVVLMLNIALSPVAISLGLFIGAFALTDSLLILSAFFMYRMSKSLAPVISKPKMD
jgi:hypothetical protein